MIGYLKGKVLSVSGGNVLLDAGGVGFEVYCSSQAYCKLANEKEGEIYTYLNYTQEGPSLYGFISLQEKNMFLKLISVSGVGAKMAIAILSGLNLSELALSIATGDVKRLSAIKGCGKKTAERIILELKESVSSLDAGGAILQDKTIPVMAGADNDAAQALMSLGFSRAESVNAISRAKERGANTLEEIISLAVKFM